MSQVCMICVRMINIVFPASPILSCLEFQRKIPIGPN